MIPSLVINLARSPERWEHAKSQLKLVTSKFLRLDAVDARQLDLKDQSVDPMVASVIATQSHRRSHYEIDGRGAIGCFKSHIKCWETQVSMGIPWMAVFEDDIIWASVEAQTQVRNVLRGVGIPADARLFLLGYLEHSSSVDATTLRASSFTGTCAYVIHIDLARELLARARPIKYHVDMFINFVLTQLDLWRFVYALPRAACTGLTREFGTTIHSDICSMCFLDEGVVRWSLVGGAMAAALLL